jgi:hypothetical protein
MVAIVAVIIAIGALIWAIKASNDANHAYFEATQSNTRLSAPGTNESPGANRTNGTSNGGAPVTNDSTGSNGGGGNTIQNQ